MTRSAALGRRAAARLARAADGIVAALLVAALAFSGCGKSEPAPAPAAAQPAQPAQPAAQPAAQLAAQPAAPVATPETVVLRIQAVDLEGRPVARMMPIATTQANAFDKPVAQGDLTSAEGLGTISLPAGQHLCIRAWDPDLKMFANSYFEVDATPEAAKDTLQVVMVPASAIDAVLKTADGKPVAQMPVGLMMIHPSEGPWWPAEAQTDAEGVVHFAAVPAGKFTLRIKIPEHAPVEIPEAILRPGGTQDLGTVSLQ